MGGFRLLAHTADMGIEAEGDSPAEVFVAAARGLRCMIFGETAIAATRQISVEVEGADHAELLVAWLGEILYRFEVDRLAPAEFAIDEIDAGRVKGRILGETFDPHRHPVEREVKAITYHQVRVAQVDGGWRARVYVDL